MLGKIITSKMHHSLNLNLRDLTMTLAGLDSTGRLVVGSVAEQMYSSSSALRVLGISRLPCDTLA